MLALWKHTLGKVNRAAGIVSGQGDGNQRPQSHPIEAVGIFHRVPKLERFRPEFLTVVELSFFPRDPGEVRFCHRDVFDQHVERGLQHPALLAKVSVAKLLAHFRRGSQKQIVEALKELAAPKAARPRSGLACTTSRCSA